MEVLVLVTLLSESHMGISYCGWMQAAVGAVVQVWAAVPVLEVPVLEGERLSWARCLP